MRLLQINAVYGVGSTGVITRDIHSMALRNNIDSFVAYSSTEGKDTDVTGGYKIGGRLGKKMHALFCRINGMQAYYSRHSTKKLLKYINNIKPDVVHLHNLHSNYINLNMLLDFLAKNNISTVVTLHDCWYYTGGCFHYTSIGCDGFKHGCGKCPKKRQDTPAYLFDRSAKILNDRYKYFSKIKNLTFVGVSDWISNEVRKSLLKDKKIITIHNGIDTEIFKPSESDFKTEHNLQNKKIILGPASKWLCANNSELLKKLIQNLPEDCAVVLLGCSKSQIDSLPKNILPLPFINNKSELCKIYSAADVFVNPTAEDTLSLINLEAQSCNTPVITFCNTGAKETVDGKNSFCVRNNDSDELLKKINTVLRCKDKNTGCRDFIKKNFNIHENYKQYLSLYQSVAVDKVGQNEL